MPKLKDPAEERFVQLYIAGPDNVRGNATECMLAAVDEKISRDAAASRGSRALKRRRVRARMRELRGEALSAEEARLRDWMSLAPAAQETLIRAAAGTLPEDWSDQRIRSAVEAAKELLNRAVGTVAQQHEVRTSGGIVVGVLHAQADGDGPDLRTIAQKDEQRMIEAVSVTESQDGS